MSRLKPRPTKLFMGWFLVDDQGELNGSEL